MQGIRPYRSSDYDRARDVVIDAVRDVIAERGLTKKDLLVPDAPKELLTTADAEAAKSAIAAAARRRIEAKRHTCGTIRARYRPMSKSMFERLRREGEEGHFSLMRLFLIAEALGLKIKVSAE